MEWKTKVQEAILLRRYKRFFADVQFSSGIEVAHVANTGSLKSALEPGQACLVSAASNPERKLRWSLEAVRTSEGAWVGVNTSWPNQIAEEAFNNKIMSHWKKFDVLQREVKINKESRLDLMLQNTKSGKQHFVEIKNVTLKIDGNAAFPDGVTERGQKHLLELMKLQKEGYSTEILFVVQRSDCKSFSPADEIDPEYGRLLRKAEKQGVRISAFVADVSLKGISLTDKKLRIDL